MKKYLVAATTLSLFFLLVFIAVCFGQEKTDLPEGSVVDAKTIIQDGILKASLTKDISYEVNRIYPAIFVTKGKLKLAHTLVDLNRHYQPTWVKEYISVEVVSSHQGEMRKAVGKTDALTQEQKDNMASADIGTAISVNVQYLPENTLAHNDVKEMGFSFTVAPESGAQYPGGQQGLEKYLKEKAIDKIPAASFKQYELVAVTFTVDEAGQVVHAKLAWPSKDDKIDKLLLGAINDMPSWKPASYANGIQVKQEFVFTVGDMESCATNFFKTREG